MTKMMIMAAACLWVGMTFASPFGNKEIAFETKGSRGIKGSMHKGVQLWEDGPYWAETNVGAEKPWEYGYYFWWGDTVGYKRENSNWVASDGSTAEFSFECGNTPSCKKNLSELLHEGWITTDGVLSPKHDAARVQWGGGWRMPTYRELWALEIKCTKTHVETNGISGWEFRGRGDYASACIFLPGAGSGYKKEFYNGPVEPYNPNSQDGFYWSSVPLRGDDYHPDSSHAYQMYVYRRTTGIYYSRCNGYTIRPVREFSKQRKE